MKTIVNGTIINDTEHFLQLAVQLLKSPISSDELLEEMHKLVEIPNGDTNGDTHPITNQYLSQDTRRILAEMGIKTDEDLRYRYDIDKSPDYDFGIFWPNGQRYACNNNVGIGPKRFAEIAVYMQIRNIANWQDVVHRYQGKSKKKMWKTVNETALRLMNAYRNYENNRKL